MSTTDFGALSAARKKVWSTQIWMQARDQSFWMSNGWVGGNTNDATRPIQRITELTKTERGDECIMQLVADLQGDGVVGDNILNGNEEALFNDAQVITIDKIRHGVRSKGEMAEQRTVIRFRATATEKLAFKIADQLDELLFLTASGVSYTLKTTGITRVNSQLPSLSFASSVVAPSSNRILYAGAATSTASLTASDKINWDIIVRANAIAKRRHVKPIRDRGKDYYAVVMSTEQQRDLKLDPTYQTLVAKGQDRGSKNPLFTNALAVIDGTVLYDHNKVFCTLDAASGSKYGAAGAVDGAQALHFGAQAMGLALLGQPETKESDINDYGNRPAVSIGRMFGMLKPQFKSLYDSNTRQDFGVISIYTAAGPTI
jgi:N4-gp56 family major capsid protein